MTAIGDSAFYSCYSLTNVTIPGSVTSFGSDVFLGNSKALQLTVERDSDAERYAQNNGLAYNHFDSLD